MKKTRAILELLALVAVLAVLMQTILEDLAVLAGWSVSLRRGLLFAGLGLDVFLTIEYILRGYHAYRYRHFRKYLFRQGGWIDLVASMPLLLLASGPAALAELAGGLAVAPGGLLLAVRHLRLLRFLKLFRYLGPGSGAVAGGSLPAGRITPVVRGRAPLVVAAAVVALTGVELALPSGSIAEAEDIQRQERTLTALQEQNLLGQPEELRRFLEAREVLLLEYQGRVLYSRYSQTDYEDLYGPGDYQVLERGDLLIFGDLKPFLRNRAAAGLRYATLAAVLVLGIGFLGAGGIPGGTREEDP
ncbi:Ion transport protein [Alkalispirochaeta americana]|uniref:Ion transport protein n=1 Tax=Alkalispirochaeta americana TaxID=159291 RepID=A0A1N6NDY0_9SPIO|nr:ion transporter [Alkalispirochaeta americana]SIP90290.1 Ion transport protein [Alkalispirochaeta americana]